MSRLYEEDRNEESPVFNPLYPAPDMFLYHDTSSVFSHLLYPPPSQSSPDHTLDCDSGYSDWIVPFGSQPTPHSGLHHDTRTEQSLWPELLKVRHLTGSEENLSLSELILVVVTDNGTDDNPTVIHSFSLADPPRVDQETVPGLELLVTPPRGVPSSGDTDCFYNTTGSQLLHNSCWNKPGSSSDKILSEITIRESMYFKLCQSGLGQSTTSNLLIIGRYSPKRLLIIVRFNTSDEMGHSSGQSVHEKIKGRFELCSYSPGFRKGLCSAASRQWLCGHPFRGRDAAEVRTSKCLVR